VNVNELFRLARDGDRRAQEDLFALLSARFRFFARRKISCTEDSEEVAQEALMVVAEKLQDLEEDTNLAGWAHRVLEIRILRYYRKHYLEERKMLQMRDEHHPFAAWMPDLGFRQELMKCLARVARRNTRYARVLNLHYQGYSVDEVSKMIGVTRDNYYVILSRARTMLERCLDSGENSL
jgi:RNA polymerase sigma-70 factor (ECF subfamily)